MSPAKVFLVDGHAFCYRAFFAVKELRNSKGQPTNAVFGFLNILRKIRKEFKPEYMAVCFDAGKKTGRHAKYAEYKIQRPSMPEDLAAQLPVIKDLLKAYRIPIFEKEGFEADDILATLAKRFTGSGREVVIASDDKDMYQLVSDGISIYSSRRDAVMGAGEAKERYGITPAQMVDYLALTGDASDNIPGVDGIGEVTARQLINTFGSLDNILLHVDQLQGKMKEKIEKGRQLALLSRELAVLDTNLEVECRLEDLKVETPDSDRLRQLFRQLEFRGFEEDLPAPVAGVADPLPAPEQMPEVPCLLLGDDVTAMVDEALSCGIFSCVLLSEGTDSDLVSEGLCAFAGKRAYRFALEQLEDIRTVLEAPEVRKVLYGYKDLLKYCRKIGVDIRGDILDAQLAGYLLKSGQSAFSVEALSWAYLNVAPRGGSDSASQVAAVLARLQAPIEKALDEGRLRDLYGNIELPLSRVLAAMELEGVKVDVAFLAEMSVSCTRLIEDMTRRLYDLAGSAFNLNSPKQLGEVLFGRLGLPVVKRTKTGPSTDEEVLLKLAPRHELPALILEYRGLAKLKSTYIDALPRMVDPRTGRVHCSFNQTGAETGRLSSNHPNLQNIPVRTEMGRQIRKAFVPTDGTHLLLSADYSQIELRVLAHLAGEPNLQRAFEQGEDIHNYTAGLMFDVPPDKVTSEMRYNAKRINFGIVYGMSAFGLAKDLAVSQKEAQAFIDTYFARYPGIRNFMDREIQTARKLGYVETLLGRRRYLPDINSKNPAVRQFAERQAINTPVQGTAADLIKLAMVRVAEKLDENDTGTRMIITVHDELVFDVPKTEINGMAAVIKQAMEGTFHLSVPLEVSIKVGDNWAEMKKL